MFEDICIVCGKPLHDAGYGPVLLHRPFQSQTFQYYSRAYCSDDCQTSDISSPSISSSSSGSPNLGCAYGDDVPPLVPSALGSALKNYMTYNHYNVSSSASSASWSVLTDDEDDEAMHHLSSGSSDHDVSDGIYDGSSKPATTSSGLSYARRPSGTNNSSTVPHPHKRMYSDSSFRPGQCIPRSVPIYSHSTADDDEHYFGIGSLPEATVDADDSDPLSERDWSRTKPKYQGVKAPKRSRNRASLPACFSLLQMSSTDIQSSPVLSSSRSTLARPSPSTPKATIDNTFSQAQFPPTVHSTPRGRRREAGNSWSTRPSVNLSASGSRSRSRPLVFEENLRPSFRSRTDLNGSTEKLVDWSSVSGFPRRGRATLRRNSSPLPKMLITMEDSASVLGPAVKSRQEAEMFESRSRSCVRTRGRVRVEDLGRDAHSSNAPGFGYGRSGLRDRERDFGFQLMRILPC